MEHNGFIMDDFRDDFIRICRYNIQFIRAWNRLRDIKHRRAVTVFGSARTKPIESVNIDKNITSEELFKLKLHNYYYKVGVYLGYQLAKRNIVVITGGGPGQMEAANYGAWLAGGESIGLNIVLPNEQKANRYLNRTINFTHIFIRKVNLLKYSDAVAILPGGFGTLDECMEAATLDQIRLISYMPVILWPKDFYQGYIDWINKYPVAQGLVSAKDMKLLALVEDYEEILKIIDNWYEFGSGRFKTM